MKANKKQKLIASALALALVASTVSSTVTAASVAVTNNESASYAANSSISQDFSYETLSDGTISITKYKGGKKDVIIPSEIDGYTVTAIGQEAFRTIAVTSVTIPSSVKEIGQDAFEYCTSLTSVNLSNGIKKIGRSAFYHCTSLKNITIPNSVNEIGWGAFYKCTSFTNIIIPNSVTIIGSTAFANCTSLTSITLSNNIKNIDFNTFSGCSSLKSVTIPNGVTSIDQTSFLNCISLTSVTIPDSVTKIGQRAFSGCSSLTSIDLPKNVEIIMEGAFSNCRSLKNINVSTENNDYCSIDGVVFDKEKAYLISCPAGKSGAYNIPNSVKEISGWAFGGCTSLTNITIPNSVTDIGYNAFLDCSSLTSLNVPDSVTKIRGEAFKNCKSLTSLRLPSIFNHQISVPSLNNQIWDGTFFGCSSLTSITIPNNIKTIGDNAFFECKSLKNIKIPNGVTSIGNKAFFNCSSLTKVVIPDSVVSIVHGAFMNCDSLTSINIPNGVTKIEGWTFVDCSSLTSINIPSSVTEIEATAFSGCSSLKNITIPDGVKEIKANTFSECSSLTNITIPNNATEIGDYAFRNCSSLTSIIIPSSVTKIGENTFYNCNKLAIYGNKGSYAEEYANQKNITFKILAPLANNSTISATSITKGQTIKLTAKATGGIAPYKYRYFCKPEGDSSWTPLTGTTTATSFTHKPARAISYQYAVKIADANGKTSTKYFTVKVNTPLVNVSTISATTITKGQSIKLTAKATGGTAPYKYRYFCKPQGDKNWTPLTSTTTATSFTHKPARAISYQYAVKVADSTGKVVTKYFTVKVNTPATTLENNSTISSTAITKGQTIKLTAKATSGKAPYKYRYFCKPEGDKNWTPLTSTTTATSFTHKPARAIKYQYAVKVADSTGKVITKYFTVTVK